MHSQALDMLLVCLDAGMRYGRTSYDAHAHAILAASDVTWNAADISTQWPQEAHKTRNGTTDDTPHGRSTFTAVYQMSKRQLNARQVAVNLDKWAHTWATSNKRGTSGYTHKSHNPIFGEIAYLARTLAQRYNDDVPGKSLAHQKYNLSQQFDAQDREIAMRRQRRNTYRNLAK